MNSRERWTPPVRAGGGFKVAVALSAVALLLLTASSAFGAADPLKGGSTTIAIGVPKKVKMAAKGGATKSGKKKVILPITGGSLDPTNGSGPVQNGGSIQFKKGNRKAKLTAIVTTFGSGGSISAKLNGKKKKLASISGGVVGRAGFGGTVDGASAKLTKKGAKALNAALGITHGGFKNGKLGKISTTTVPLTVTVTSATSQTNLDLHDIFAGCTATGTCTTYAGKLVEDGVSTSYSNGASMVGPVVTFTPQTGGNMAPDCTGGQLTGSQGAVTLTRNANGHSITQANPIDNFDAHSVSFDATASPGGPLGRAAATDLAVTPGTCSADPANHKITLTATQTVNPLAAQVGDQVLGLAGTNCPAPAPNADCPLTGGESVGTSTYEIHTQ